MVRYLKKYWMWCLLAPLFMLGEISVDLIQPALMATIVDDGVLGQNLSVILHIGTKMILLVLCGGFCGIMSGVFAQLASQQFGNDLRKDLFKKIMSLSFQQTDQISTGSLVTRLTNDVTQVQRTIEMSIRSAVRCSVMFAGGIVMLYLQSARFALVVACGLPFVIFLVAFFLRKSSPLFTTVQNRLDDVNNVMQENVAAGRVVKAYGKENYEQERFESANQALCGINLRVQSLLAFLSPCMNIVLNLCVVGVIAAGGITVRSGGAMTPGSIMAAITYLALILNGMMFMANIFQTFTRAKASVVRIREVLDSPDALPSGAFSQETKKRGEVELRNVWFAYPGAGGDVLRDVSLTVHSGETLAILGATGSGKTSLVNLIPRFYDVTGGAVLVDGVDVRTYDHRVLRDKVAIVMQKAQLYSRPIEANIRWGSMDADPWQIKRAAEAAQADDFICAAPDGYYTMVSENGHSLSGGQKQRISIARAVLKNAEILIFDDATSALDLKTEAQLYGALGSACPGATKILIAQRIASVKNADRIAVLEQGRIVACGSHEALLRESPVYRDICSSQRKEEETNV